MASLRSDNNVTVTWTYIFVTTTFHFGCVISESMGLLGAPLFKQQQLYLSCDRGGDSAPNER